MFLFASSQMTRAEVYWTRAPPGTIAPSVSVGNVAAFAASDRARTITGSTLNITCGTVVDWPLWFRSHPLSRVTTRASS